MGFNLACSSTSGATTEETNKRDGGWRGEKRRRHDDKLVAAELAWQPAVAAAVAAVVVAAAVAAAAQHPDCLNFRWEKSNLVRLKKKTHKKQSPYRNGESPNRFPNRGVPESVWGSFQFGDQHIIFLYSLAVWCIVIVPNLRWALSDQKGMSYLAKKKSLTKRAYTDHKFSTKKCKVALIVWNVRPTYIISYY